MPYVSPGSVHTPTTGAAPPAGWGTAVNDGFDWFADDRPRARVYNTNAIAIVSGTPTALTFNSERYDVGGCHSTSSNPSRLTVPSGGTGLYAIGGSVRFAGSHTGSIRQIYIRINGSTIIAVIATPGIASSADWLTINSEWEMNAGDYAELIAVQSSGGAMDVVVAASYSPEFWFRWVCNVQ